MKSIPIFMSILLLCVVVQAQDLMIKRNGDELNVKILEIGLNEIKYKKTENLDSSLYIILKSEVFMIKYENGSKDIFENTNVTTQNNYQDLERQKEEQVIEIINQANEDAIKNYKNYGPAATAGFMSGALLGPLGIAVALPIGLTVPSSTNAGYPNKEMAKYGVYYSAYFEKVKKIKNSKVLVNYGIGLSLFCGSLVLYNSLITLR